jgi:hypothetical protein
MNCCFCQAELESPDDAVDLGWVPAFWHELVEYAGPICPDCRARRLSQDENGKYNLKPGYAVPLAAIRMPQFPLNQPPYRHENQKFWLGLVTATPAALRAIDDAGQTPDFFLDRHAQGDWGEADWRLNDEVLATGERILSAYRTLRNVRLWIITEPDRSGTTIVLAEQ